MIIELIKLGLLYARLASVAWLESFVNERNGPKQSVTL